MDHYGKARRDGLRIYSAALQAHEDPYLPVLERKVPELSSLTRLSLGVMSVPLSRVLGSVSEGRSKAFTRGFLPILEGGSEFASKWDRLYESVESEGVNQPVTALEYLGYYYVIEGNKRVSVMKTMEAREIEADVHRVGPDGAILREDANAKVLQPAFDRIAAEIEDQEGQEGQEASSGGKAGRRGRHAKRRSTSYAPSWKERLVYGFIAAFFFTFTIFFVAPLEIAAGAASELFDAGAAASVSSAIA